MKTLNTLTYVFALISILILISISIIADISTKQSLATTGVISMALALVCSYLYVKEEQKGVNNINI